MAIDLISAGVKLYYSVEMTKGTRPTTLATFTQLPGLKEVPEINPEPETIETTTLDNLEYKTYVKGLKDVGGALSFTFNLTQDFMDKWGQLVDDYDASVEGEKKTWFVIVIPGLDESLYFTGEPSPIGLPSIGVNSVLEVNAYIVPNGEPIWETAPTTA